MEYCGVLICGYVCGVGEGISDPSWAWGQLCDPCSCFRSQVCMKLQWSVIIILMAKCPSALRVYESFKFILDECVREGTQKEKQKPNLEVETKSGRISKSAS